MWREWCLLCSPLRNAPVWHFIVNVPLSALPLLSSPVHCLQTLLQFRWIWWPNLYLSASSMMLFTHPTLGKPLKTELLAAIPNGQTWIFSPIPHFQPHIFSYLTKPFACTLPPGINLIFILSSSLSYFHDVRSRPLTLGIASYPWSIVHPKVPARLIFLKHSVGS